MPMNIGYNRRRFGKRVMLAPPDFKTVTGAYTVHYTDMVILADATGDAFSVTLPDARKILQDSYVLKKIDSTANAVTVDGLGSQTIDGETTYVLDSQWDSITLASDGANWFVLAQRE